MPLGALDVVVIIGWLSLTLGVGLVAGLRSDSETYWVNRRLTSSAPLVFTIVATQVGVGAIIGIASATFSSGLGFGVVSLISTITGFLAVAYFAPAIKRFGDRYRAITLLELFRVRYGRMAQTAAGCIVAFTYLSVLAAQFLGSSWLLAMGTGLSIKAAVVLATFGVVVYSAFGGLRADIVTDGFHFWAMTAVLLGILMPVLVIGEPPKAWLSEVPMSIWSPLTFGGPGFLVVGIALGVMVPVLAPELWQKIYASRGDAQARKVFLISTVLVAPFYLFAIYIGLFGYTRYVGQIAGDQLLFRVMADWLPRWAYPFGLAAVLAVAVSTSNTLIVTVSATVHRDILRLDDSMVPLSRGRWLSAAVGAFAAILALSMPNIVQLLLNGYYLLLVLVPALIGTAIWGRATAVGAVASIVAGTITTVAALFIAPRQAFLPGVAVSALVFIFVSMSSRHSAAETRVRREIFGS
jgi:Na+/proline symporter